MSEFKNGALIDDRPAEARAKDWSQLEVVAAAGNVQWREKAPGEMRAFPIFHQNGSGSCVAQTEAKELGIMRYLTDGVYVHFSATDIYQRRANEGTGMGADDARKIAKEGVTLEVLTPSQNMTDAQMDGAVVEPYKRQVGDVFAARNYLALPIGDVERVASTIQATGKGVMTWLYFLADEWTDRPQIKHPGLNLFAETTLRHSVTAVDFTLQGNERCVVIEDSWGPGAGIGGRRIIPESFFKARNWYAGYMVNFKFQEGQVQKPHYLFHVDLQKGDSGPDVKALQEICRYEGTFPANAEATGFFGEITKKAVGDMQVKRGIVPGPSAEGWGRCGPKTRLFLNIEYGP